jgi:hypothetical protein
MAAACGPSRAWLLTGHYPWLHGETQTDGISKGADNPEEMFWPAPDTVPTLGDWFRAGQGHVGSGEFRSMTVSSVGSCQLPRVRSIVSRAWRPASASAAT